MKRSAIPGDGPRRKRLAHTTDEQDDQDPPCLKEAIQVVKNDCTEPLWTGTIEFHDSSQTLSDDQRQTRFVSGCSVRSSEKINSVKYWPKQLKMHTIQKDTYHKIRKLNKKSEGYMFFVSLCIDEDNGKMSHAAFLQSTCTSINIGCAVLEHTSSVVWLLILASWSSGDEIFTIGRIHELKHKYKDRVVELLRSRGMIISHATTEDVLAKENARLTEELLLKDKQIVEQKILHQEEVERQEAVEEERSEEKARMVAEIEALIKETDEKLRKIVKLEKEKEKILVEQKQLFLKQKTKVMAQCWQNQERMKEQMKAEQIQESLMLTNQLIEMETCCSELKKEVASIKQANLDDIKKIVEYEVECSICRTTFIKSVNLACSHSFCASCIQQWCNQSVDEDREATCPNCRKPI